MKKENKISEESIQAGILRSEISKTFENHVQQTKEKANLEHVEYISKQEQPYISPIMTMSQDEILDFVESFEVSELATLSVAELNRIGEVLGVDPKILTEEE